MEISKINSSLTIDYLTQTPENLYLDRKRAKVSLQDLANEVASFANHAGITCSPLNLPPVIELVP